MSKSPHHWKKVIAKEIRHAHLAAREKPAKFLQIPYAITLKPFNCKAMIKSFHRFKWEEERRQVQMRRHTKRTTPGDSDLPLDHPHIHPNKVGRILENRQRKAG